MNRRHLTVMWSGLLLGAVALAGCGALNERAAADAPLLPPCATEDSTDCLWDADTRGNGEGTSFVDVDGETYTLVPTPTPTPTAEPEPVAAPVNEDPATSAGAAQSPQWESPDGVADWPYTTGETLVCGQGAKPAIDHRDDAVGWWAYCEPALVQP